MSQIRRVVTKFGSRGAHITMPNEWIGKEVVVLCHMAVESVRELEKPKNRVCHMAKRHEPNNRHMAVEELDQAEQDFVNRWPKASEDEKKELYKQALKQWDIEDIVRLIKITE